MSPGSLPRSTPLSALTATDLSGRQGDGVQSAGAAEPGPKAANTVQEDFQPGTYPPNPPGRLVHISS